MPIASLVTLPVQNMNCGSCSARVLRLVEKVTGTSDVAVNLAQETVQLRMAGEGTSALVLNTLAEAGYPTRAETAVFSVTNMSCGACVARLDQALRAGVGVRDVHVNLADETARITFVPGLTDVAGLSALAQTAGYPMRLQEDTDRTAEKEDEAARKRRAMMISAALALPVFVLEMGGHMIPTWHHFVMRTIGHQANWMIQFLFTTLILIGPGRVFFIGGIAALMRRAPNMNSLVALGAGAAWCYSTLVLLAPQMLPLNARFVYFEAAAVIVTLILTGRWFEARAKGQTGAAIQKLIGLQPRVALVQQGEDWVEKPIAALQINDIFRIRPGERVAIDATVTAGSSTVDESMITGEPMPVPKTTGAPLTGVTINGTGSLTCAVRRVGGDTTLSQIIRMVQTAQGARLPIQALVDRVTLWFVPIVLGIAVVTVAAWLMFGPSLSHALVAAVSVLIIACPCAMGLATPTSIMVGTGRAAELGVLFRQGDALQALGGVGMVVFDKTGTLTQGRPALTGYVTAPDMNADQVLARIAAVESLSEHPVARAIVVAARHLELPQTVGFESITGQGVHALADGVPVAIGNARMMADAGVDLTLFEEDAKARAQRGETVFFASIAGQAAALLSVSDPLKSGSTAAIAALRSKGLGVAMITGDAAETAQSVADAVGITEVVAGVDPAGKVAALRKFKAGGTGVAFVGDGINDAPVLAEADVGIAIGTGTDVAIETADVVLMSGDIGGVKTAFDVSRLTLRNIWQNLFWAFGYNVLLIPVAAGVFFAPFGWLLSPGLAAGAMAFSSVFVLTNALRLRRLGVQV